MFVAKYCVHIQFERLGIACEHFTNVGENGQVVVLTSLCYLSEDHNATLGMQVFMLPSMSHRAVQQRLKLMLIGNGVCGKCRVPAVYSL